MGLGVLRWGREGGREGLRGVGCCEGKRNECGVVVVLRLGGWKGGYIGRS
jgi:hypothetical protein